MANNKATLDKIQPVRVCLAIGCQETIKAKTLESIVGTMMSLPNTVTSFSMRIGGDIVSARGACVEYALEKQATHIFFFDHDMKFPADTLKRLLAHDKDIITVEYNRRKLPLESVTQPLTERSETELYKAQVIGGGCLLIKMSVFEKLPQPWFNFGRKGYQVVIGEDTWFARTAMDSGFDVWIDPTISVKHLGEYEY